MCYEISSWFNLLLKQLYKSFYSKQPWHKQYEMEVLYAYFPLHHKYVFTISCLYQCKCQQNKKDKEYVSIIMKKHLTSQTL